MTWESLNWILRLIHKYVTQLLFFICYKVSLLLIGLSVAMGDCRIFKLEE